MAITISGKKTKQKKNIYLYEKGLLIMIIQNMIIKIFDKREMQRLKSVNQLINQALQPRNKKFIEFKNCAVVRFEETVCIHLLQLFWKDLL